jgi:hypothetical protein
MNHQENSRAAIRNESSIYDGGGRESRDSQQKFCHLTPNFWRDLNQRELPSAYNLEICRFDLVQSRNP